MKSWSPSSEVEESGGSKSGEDGFGNLGLGLGGANLILNSAVMVVVEKDEVTNVRRRREGRMKEVLERWRVVKAVAAAAIVAISRVILR